MIKLILFALVFTIVAHCEVVDLFTQPDFKGDRHQIDLTPQCNDYGCTIKCFALPGHMENNVESINTHDGCIRLYAGKHCVGDVVVVRLLNGEKENEFRSVMVTQPAVLLIRISTSVDGATGEHLSGSAMERSQEQNDSK